MISKLDPLEDFQQQLTGRVDGCRRLPRVRRKVRVGGIVGSRVTNRVLDGDVLAENTHIIISATNKHGQEMI